MNIITSFNDNYLLPEKTMIKSLLCNNIDLKIYILYTELSQSSMNSIMELVREDDVRIIFIKIEGKDFSSLPLISWFSVEAYFRLYAYKYLPFDVDRALWLDSDIIVNGNLLDFYTQSFEDKLFVAVKDAGCITGEINSAYKKKIGMPEAAIYVNSGVLLMNIEEMRSSITEIAVNEYLKKHKKSINYPDQDILNAVYWNRLKVIDELRYNFQLTKLSKKDAKKYMDSAIILHYIGSKKPWKTRYYRSGFNEYWQYAKQIPELKQTYNKLLISRLLYSAFFYISQIPGVNRLLYKVGRLK